MPAPDWNTWLQRLKDISIIATCVGGVIGIYATVSTVQSGWKQGRLAGISQAREVIEKEDAITEDLNAFLTAPVRLSPEELLKKYGSGRALYYSDELKTFRKICHHYEKVGALIHAEYIDFDLYYEIVSFPDEFWERTEHLRRMIKENWGGKNLPLEDFLKNFGDLKARYEKQRARDARKSWFSFLPFR